MLAKPRGKTSVAMAEDRPQPVKKKNFKQKELCKC
jgi:hypothetical protein